MSACPNCGFFNLPGSSNCGRCNMSLALATTAIDVHPPRATRWGKRWQSNPLGKRWRTRSEVMRTAVGDWWNRDGVTLPPSHCWLAALVPGLPQLWQGDRFVGLAILGAFCGLSLVALALFGTFPASLAMGLAFACHQASLYDLARTIDRKRRFRLTFLLIGFVMLAVYSPAWWLTSSRLSAVVLSMNSGELLAGDTLIVSRRAYVGSSPQVGDLVRYQPLTQTLTVRRGYNIRLRDDLLDRVLAVAGQSVSAKGGRLLVEGRPAQFVSGLGMLQFADSPVAQIPAGRVLIAPSAIAQLQNGLRPEQPSLRIAEHLVPVDQITGQAILRHRPWLRWSRISRVETP